MRKILFILFQIVLWTAVPTIAQTNTNVNSVTELQTMVSAASTDSKFTLTDAFVTDFNSQASAISLIINSSAKITVDGANLTLKAAVGKDHFSIGGSGEGTLTIQNIILTGLVEDTDLINGEFPKDWSPNASKIGGGITGGFSGYLKVENCLLSKMRPVSCGLSVTAKKVMVKESSFISLGVTDVYGGASAIYTRGSTSYEIEDCTFAYNFARGSWANPSGVIYITVNVAEIISFKNSRFYKNTNCTAVKDGAAGGGAIAVKDAYPEKFIVENCEFVENEIDSFGELGNTADGGAIYFYHHNAGGSYPNRPKINISNSTFTGNSAFDEGGAIAFVGQYLVNAEVRNNTFYGNTARGDQRKGTYTADGFDGGGAIEVDTKATVIFENNTVIKNIALKGTATSGNAGGGISVYGSGKATLRNNIISGNESTYSYSGGYPDIYPAITSASWTSKTGRNIIGEPLVNIFGLADPKPIAYGNKKAGDPRWDGTNENLYSVIRTIPILPNDKSLVDILPSGLADDTVDNSTLSDLLNKDQNDNTRITANDDFSDSGSIEILWVRFNANGGNWKDLGENNYVGTDYYNLEDGKTTYYYKVTNHGGKVSSPTTAADKLVHPDGKQFHKWVTDDAEEKDWVSSAVITENKKYKALWKEDALEVTYHSNFDPDKTYKQTYDEGKVITATYPATGLPQRPNHIFIKWTTNADGTGTAYQPGASFTITENIDLYAQWESSSTLKLQWSVSKTTPEIYEFNDVENNSTTTVMVGTPVYVQIRPIELDHIDFDTWSIEYAATPDSYHYPMDEAIGKTVRYDFNKGEAHTLEGTYYYNVTRLILYKNGLEVTSYIYRNASCTHKVIILSEPVVKDPVLQWSVSTITHELPYFKDVDDQTTTSVNYGTPVFVQIRPVGYDGITFERWDVEYAVTPVEHYYGMNPTLKTERHSFNNKEAHTEKGTYIYTVTKLTLYDLYGNQIVETYDYNNSPYRHTIVICDGEGPGPGPGGALQWSVSTASNKLEDFRDVDNLTTTAVNKGTPVYVQIRPVGFNNVTYDRWEIEYTATPADYHYPLEETVARTERYTFNKGEAHTLVGTYVYNVYKLTLYNGESIATEQYYTEPAYIHTIIIRDGGLIGLGKIAPYCSVEGEFRIPVQLLDPDNILEYSVRFSDEALNAGFKDTEYRDVTPNYLTVPVSSIIAKGIYTGNVYVRKKSDPGLVELHPFEIEVLQTTMITRQPQSINVCDGDAFTLSVEAIGINLSYQWFFNEEAIPGATSDSYTAALTPEKEGIYYVDVYGDCGMESSRTVTVSKNGLRILVKWNEFLYITNQDNEFVRFQWYKDGQKIDKNGTSIYYSVPEGLLGTYFIQAYRADDTYVVSCPITFETLTQFQSTRVYPTMVNKNTPITIQTGAPDETPESAVVEVYNLNGQIVNRLEMKTWETTLSTDMASGSYIVKVTTESGRTTTHKIIIK
ncbi:T9SS type A sorting domain-containing protein [Parabacteroides timonensis]|uniref:T9SS type A sorting domain-containing protein n=3 Tax=Parabacteroides TaxID=375288 RepID=UPI00094F3337|nr:T9SS type A sorting domain-containing protein [Parabacteroides timonensis]